MLIRRIARPMLATIFIAGGIDSLRNPKPRAAKAQGLVDKSVNTLPDSVTDKVPTEAETLVRINGAVQVGGGLLLATGTMPRLAALGLAGSLVPTTLAGHAFWEEADPTQRALARIQFYKNVSLLGGLLITAVDTEGKPSLAWRGRRKATAASQALAAALPAGAVASESSWESIRDRSHEGAHALGVKSAEAAEIIRHRAPELAEAARELADEYAEIIKNRAPELAEAARDRSTDVAELLRQRAPELADELAALATSAKSKAQDGVEEGRRRWRGVRS